MVTGICYKKEGTFVKFLHLEIVLTISDSWNGNLVCHEMQFVLLKPADPEFEIWALII